MSTVIALIIGVILVSWGTYVVTRILQQARRDQESLRRTRAELDEVRRRQKKEIEELVDKRNGTVDRMSQKLNARAQEIRELKDDSDRVRRACEEAIARKDQEVTTMLREASEGFPWLARALANYETLRDFQLAEYLQNKEHPATKAAARVREVAARSREFRTEYHIARARVDYYETLFPWLEEYVGVDLDTLIDLTRAPADQQQETDPVAWYLAPGEYERLSPAARNQLALDRYMAKKKSPWELGRDYERSIGYLLENEGYNVEYHGISEGLSDLGRDLIARKGNDITLVQCKYWSQHKTIHEKHIAQLFGTTVKFMIENGNPSGGRIIGLFITSTALSEMARAFAEQLRVEVRERVAFEPYPMIKCNIGRDEFGSETRIYHLPMDQQYDRTKIVKTAECYVATVAEAERLGFRRAWRWHPERVE